MYFTHRTNFVLGKTLPLAYQLEPKLYKSVTVAQKVLTGLEPGDLVQAYGAGQVELPPRTMGPERAMHARYLKISKSGDNSHLEGLVLDRPMGVDFTQDQHYSLLTAYGSFVVTEAWAGSVTVMLVMYAANLSQQQDDPRSLSVKYVELRADVLQPPPLPVLRIDVTVDGIPQ